MRDSAMQSECDLEKHFHDIAREMRVWLIKAVPAKDEKGAYL
jgi:hypothetical protein